MALAFVGGTMNILWMAALTAMMVFDKNHYFNDRLSQFLGRTLVLAGGLILLLALTLEVSV
jgi:predicted metal-binding membrane protein